MAILAAAICFVPTPLGIPPVHAARAPADARAGVILALDEAIGVDHEENFLNRRTILTVTYETGVLLEETCSDTDPADVVLVVELPSGVQFVEARQGGDPMPPTSVDGQSLTWELGTLNRFDHCSGTELEITVEADPSLADDASLEVTASISTSTMGDDPADNEAGAVFPAVMFPLEVVVLEARTRCFNEATGADRVSDEGDFRACTHLGGQGFKSAVVSPTDPPGLLGLVTASGAFVRSKPLRLHGYASFGDAEVGAFAETRVGIENPNPFPVPIHLHFDAGLYCRSNQGGGAEARATGPIGAYVECGYGPIEDMSERVWLHHRIRGGPDGSCETYLRLTSGERDDETIDETEPGCPFQEAESGSSTDLDFALDPGLAEAGPVFLGYGLFNGTARWCVALFAHECPAGPSYLVHFVAESPVDLLVTDGEGRRVGAVDDPDGGTLEFAEIPGSSYSGSGTEPETVSLMLPDPDDYTLSVVGTGEGPYTITVRTEGDDGTVREVGTLSGQATEGMSLERGLLLGGDGRVALEPGLALDDVVSQLLGDEGPLDAGALDYLDLLGNENGGFDVGDFRAFLVSTGEIPLP